MKKFLLSFVAVMVAFSSFAQRQQRVSVEYKTEENIFYSQNTDAYSLERCVLDVYYPLGVQDCPVIVWFHGGGLTSGNKTIPEQLKNRGYVVIAANYRFMNKVDVRDCIDDAAAAVAWAFNNAAKYGGDPGNIYVSGHSAGGYLTSMIGLDKKYLAKYGIDADKIAALIPFSGQVMTHYAYRQQHGGSEYVPTIDDTSPIAHVRADGPPYVIVSGDRELELYGRYEENAYMWRMMKLIGHEQTFIYELDGYSHNAMAEPAFYILRQYVKRRVN
ncbi:MAG: alpha/beta hydrolase [Bacteroidales bacterium]|nr:alpha/beta hydrolase [Bacteroidales bacterium]MBO7479439.1 alpha/beta hydrolase [Bacteroidales bacterium]MBO7488100.1 alpha/beta hydrolase [Bacteroidales bacterium]